MRFLYFTIKFLPYWAIPSGLIVLEMSLILKKRGNHHWFVRLATLAGFFFLLTILFFVFRWDMTLYPFLKERLDFSVH